MDMMTGAENLLSVQEGVSVLGDLLLPAQPPPEESWRPKAGNVALRLAKLALLDGLATYYLVLLQHEVFGHGARARELGYEDIWYKIEPPFPFSRGGGATFYRLPYPGPMPWQQRSVMAMAGMEGNLVLARRTRTGWLRSGYMRPASSMLYVAASMDLPRYAFRTRESGRPEDGNDIRTYLGAVNEGRHGVSGQKSSIKLRDLRRGSAAVLLDPFLWFSGWTLADHLATGRRMFEYPSFRIRGMGVLPGAGYRLTPYGPEYLFEGSIAGPEWTAMAGYRRGDGEWDRAWGADVELLGLGRGGSLTADLRWHVWDQPPSEVGRIIGVTRIGQALGGALSWRPHPGSIPLAVRLEVLGKEAGHLHGESLDRGLTWRAGGGLSW